MPKIQTRLKRLAASGVATGREIALPVFDGTDAARWRVRDAGTLRLVADRAALRLGGLGGVDRLLVILGEDADAAATVLNAQAGLAAVPSFDLVTLWQAGISPRRIAALIRLYAAAFRDTGGRWNGHAMAPPDGPPRAIACLAVAWPHAVAEGAADAIEALGQAIAPRSLGVVRAGAAAGPGGIADADGLSLRPGALSGPGGDGARARLRAFAGLAPDEGLDEGLDHAADIDIAATLDRVHLMSCLSTAHDLPLLPHFLDHYTGLGVAPGHIHVILHARTADAPGLHAAQVLLSARGIVPADIWIGAYSSTQMWTRRRALHRAKAGPGDWAISADTDELHVYPQGLAAMLDQLRAHDADWLQGPMIDRVGPGGHLAAVTPMPSLWDQFPVAGDLMCQISRRPELKDGGGTVKAMLMAAHLMPGLGGHGVLREDCAARAGEIAADLGIDLAQPRTPYERSLQRAWTWAPAPLLGSNIGGHPRITDADFRLSFPAHVAHFKWRDVLIGELTRRRASGLQTKAASQYSAQLQDFLADRDRIDLGAMVRRRAWHQGHDWPAHLAALRAWSARRDDPHARPDRHAWQQPRAQPGWRVRQLTFGSAGGGSAGGGSAGGGSAGGGSAGGTGHFHSYYDIPVLSADESLVAAVRYRTDQRPLTAADTVDVGVVDIAQGGFTPIATTQAWSWQQGPMLQWVPAPGPQDSHGDGGGDSHGSGRLIWNDRVDGRFVARLARPDGSDARLLDRPIYALDPSGGPGGKSGGGRGLSLDFARLDALRPGYGYAGGTADLSDPAPQGDGIWRVDLADGAAALILSLARARDLFTDLLGAQGRAEHAGAGYVYWFNHCKIAPGGGRFTVKLRWRRPGGGWNGTMGVSLTCGLDGADPRVVARATSHVIWLDDETLYFWDQGAGHVAQKRDATLTWPPQDDIFDPAIFAANVHLRHIPDDPRRMVFDTPYSATVDLRMFDRDTGVATDIARFGGHYPERGQFRCDLHPVPTRDGGRIVMSSPADGLRQIYVAERA